MHVRTCRFVCMHYVCLCAHEVSVRVVMCEFMNAIIYFWDEVSSVGATTADGVIPAGLGVAVGDVDAVCGKSSH